ncbi:MAG TPA: ABC transporter ATP-binding protein [Candidatus Binatia bacterium]|jgi:oligopeptide/dipeptide ABC transporter ATP-binding protein
MSVAERRRPDPAAALLDVRDLHTHFETPEGVARAVDGVSFAIRPGRTLGLVGESGCGKSVTALSILRLVTAPGRIVSGSIRYQGRELLSLSEREMRHVRGKEIAMIFQEPMTSLNPVFTIGNQIAEAIRLHQGLGRAATRARVVESLRLVEIADPERRADSYPHELSGGMRQRAMIAMALACEPSLLIADEPTTALDVTIQAQILDLLRSLRERLGMAMLLITHDLGIVAEQADDVAVMYAGRIVEHGTMRDVFERPCHPYTVALMDAVGRLGGPDRYLKALPGTVPSLLRLPSGCRFRDRCPRAIDQCGAVDPPLEEKAPAHLAACIRV